MRPVVLAAALSLLAAGCGGSPSPSGAPAAATTNAPPAAAAAPLAPDFQKILGRWARTDGDYTLVLKQVRNDGALAAGYFNPGPINVSKAEVRPAAGKLNVFVELRDVNYPGCTYTLTYNPADDTLGGVYYQAMVQEQYDVQFARLRAE